MPTRTPHDVQVFTEAMDQSKLIWWNIAACGRRLTRVYDQPPGGHDSVEEAHAWLQGVANRHEIWSCGPGHFILIRAVNRVTAIWPD